MLFIKKQSLVSQAHYSLTVKSSPVSIDKIKFLFQLVNKDVTMSQCYVIIPEVKISDGKKLPCHQTLSLLSILSVCPVW